MQFVVILAVLAWLALLGGLLTIWQMARYRDAVRQRIGGQQEHNRRKAGKEMPPWLSGLADQAADMGKRYSVGMSQQRIRQLLDHAGRPSGLTPERYSGLKMLVVMGGIGLGLLLTFTIWINPLVMVLLAVVGMFAPDFWLRSAANNRQHTLARALPDFMDTMAVSLSAGSPLDPALKQVAARFPGPLAEEVGRFVQEVELGVPRADAYRRLMERNNCMELEILVQSLLQGHQLGVPVATTFTSQAKAMRVTRAQYAKEKAAKSGPKVTMVTTFLITPSVFLLILGMLVLNLIYNPDAFGIRGLF